MATQLIANFAGSTLSASITDTDTSASVISAASFPAISGGNWMWVVLSNDDETVFEICKVTGLSANIFTLVRGQDGTTARTWGAGTKLQCRPVRQAILDLISGVMPTTATRLLTPQAIGDGVTKVFTYVGPTVYRTDWQGTYLLYTSARTQLLPHSIRTGGDTDTAPTGWAGSIIGSATFAPATSTLYAGDGALAYTFTVSGNAGRCYLYQSITALANTVYCISVFIESVTGNIQAVTTMSANAIPAGATATYPVCEANPSGGPAGVIIPGRMCMVVTIGDTAGTFTFRNGIGCNTAGTLAGQSIRNSRPMVEVAPAPTSYIQTIDATPVTVIDYSVTDGLATLSETPRSASILDGLADYKFNYGKFNHSLAATDFGITGVGNETSKFELAIAEAVSLGIKTLILDVPTLTITSGTDCGGVALLGQPTAITGVLQNVGCGSTGLVFSGRNIDFSAHHPQPLGTGQAPKLVAQLDANNMIIFTPASTKGYISIKLNNNSTTLTDSMATTATDQTQWRVVAVKKVVDIFVAFQTASGTNGTWGAPLNLTVGGDEDMDNTSPLTYVRTNTNGGYKEYTIVPTQDGRFNIAFLSSATSAADVSVTVDGVAIDSNFTTVNAAGAFLMVRPYQVKTSKKPIVIRITNNTASYLNLIGVNFFKLKSYDHESLYDSYGYYEKSSVYKNPISRAVANDYAVMDYDAGLWGGSYHGGESGFTVTLLIGGNAVTIPASAALLGISKSVVLQQSSTISWASAGGGSLSVSTKTVVTDGGYYLQITFRGNLTVKTLFTTLYGVKEDFPIITYPVTEDLTSGADRDIPLGRQNHVEYRTATGNQSIQVTFSTFTGGDDSHHGGAYIKRASGLYNKLYYAPIESGKRVLADPASDPADITDIASTTQFIFG